MLRWLRQGERVTTSYGDAFVSNGMLLSLLAWLVGSITLLIHVTR